MFRLEANSHLDNLVTEKGRAVYKILIKIISTSSVSMSRDDALTVPKIDDPFDGGFFRFHVSMPFGGENICLTDRKSAEKIAMSLGDDPNWMYERVKDARYGYYWTIYPAAPELIYDEGMGLIVSLNSIVCQGEQKRLTYMDLHINGTDVKRLTLVKRTDDLKIYDASRKTTGDGRDKLTTLSWDSSAKECRLSVVPDRRFNPKDSYSFYGDKDCKIDLKCYGERGRVVKRLIE